MKNLNCNKQNKLVIVDICMDFPLDIAFIFLLLSLQLSWQLLIGFKLEAFQQVFPFDPFIVYCLFSWLFVLQRLFINVSSFLVQLSYVRTLFIFRQSSSWLSWQQLLGFTLMMFCQAFLFVPFIGAFLICLVVLSHREFI